MTRRFICLHALLGVLSFPLQAVSAADFVSFMRDVAPILNRNCEGCHGLKHADSGFRTDSFEHLMASQETDFPLIVPGNPDESELFQRLIMDDEDLRMPQETDPLTDGQTELVRRWILEGATFDGTEETAPLRRIRPPRQHPEPPDSYRRPVPVLALAYSPSGTELATGGSHEVTIWSADSGELLRRIKGLPERIDDLAYSPDGTQLLVGGGSPGDYGEFTLIDPLGAKKHLVLGTFEDVVLGVAFSHDGQHAAAGSADQSVRLYDIEGHELWTKRVHSEWVTSVSFSHDDRFLASSSKDMTVKVFDVASGELFTTFTGHRKQFGKHTGAFEVYGVAFSANTLLACSVGTDAVARLWDPIRNRDESGTAADMEQRFSKEGHTRYIKHGSKKGVLALDLEGNDLFCACRDGRITQHDVLSLKQIREYPTSSHWIYDIDFHAGTNRVASGGFEGTIQIRDTEKGELLLEFIASPGW